MIAFLPTLGFQEIFVLLVIGLLLYGRNLPEAGRKLGLTVAKLRRGLQQFKDEIDRDDSLRQLKDARDTLRGTAQEVRRIGTVPRALDEPGRVLRDLTDEALSSPPPDATSRPTPVAGSEGGSGANGQERARDDAPGDSRGGRQGNGTAD